MAKKTLGYGLISVGWMGRVHSRGLSQVPERYPDLGVAIRKVKIFVSWGYVSRPETGRQV